MLFRSALSLLATIWLQLDPNEALRAAKDRASMLDVGEAMFEEVALAAGAERAASLRERLDQLLPASPAMENFAVTQPALLG